MKKLISLAMLFIAFSFSSNADTFNEPKPGSISGKILDAVLNQPLPYVNIVIKDANNNIITGGITKDDGTFKVTGIPEGDHIVSIEYLGFKTVTKNISIGKSSNKIDLGTTIWCSKLTW